MSYMPRRREPLFEQYSPLVFLVVAFAFLAILIAGVVSFGVGLIFYLAWNHGVRHFIETLGGDVGGVSYWTAFFTAWFLTTFVGSLKGVQLNANSS